MDGFDEALDSDSPAYNPVVRESCSKLQAIVKDVAQANTARNQATRTVKPMFIKSARQSCPEDFTDSTKLVTRQDSGRA